MKNNLIILSMVALVGFAFVSCEEKPNLYEFPADEYIYEIPDVPVLEDYVVGVPYETKYRDSLNNVWWDTGNKAHQLYTGNPLLGEYDIREDSHVLQQHLEWGKEAGIDFFILSWGGHNFNDTILQNWETLWNADNSLPKVVVRLDPGYLFQGKDTLQHHSLRMDTLLRDVDSLYTHVMMHDFAYKKTDGTPVMVLCNFTNTGHIPRVNDFANSLFKNSSVIQNNIWIMAELGGGWTSPERWGYNYANGYEGGPDQGYVRPDSIKPFDAFFITDISHNNYDRYYHQYSYLDYNYRYWQDRMRPLGKEYIPTVMPSFDDRVNTPASDRYFIARWKEGIGAYVLSDSTQTTYNLSSIKENPYKKFADVAKRNAGQSRIIFVYNWNDFVNGRNIEPTVEFGKDYLEYTRQFFKK